MVRFLLASLLMAAFAVAGPDREPAGGNAPLPAPRQQPEQPPDARVVDRLVRLLAHPDVEMRRRAHARLAAMGEAVLPMLQDQRIADPEARRRLRQLTRSLRRLRLVLVRAPKRIGYGDALEIVIELRNDSDYAYRVPLTINERQRGKVKSALFLTNGARATALKPDQVTIQRRRGGPKTAVLGDLAPGARRILTIRFAPEDLPLRKPGEHRLAISYWAKVTRSIVMDLAAESAEHPTESLETKWFDVHCRSRTPGELDAALAGKDAAVRTAALLELRLRDDEALLPVLRKHVGRVPEVAFRRHAIRRLGRNAAEEDLPAILDAVRDPDEEVARAAISGLGSYPGLRKARTRLLMMTDDSTYWIDAIRALANHPHNATVRCFISKLKKETHPAVQKTCTDALRRWTGLTVRPKNMAELRAFERWWANPRNRREAAKRWNR